MMTLSNAPKGWQVKNISEVLFFQEGPGVRKWQFHDEGVKLLNVGNINNGELNLSATKIHISEEEANGKYSHFLVDEGDLLIACSGIVVSNFHNKITFAKKEHLPLCMNTSTMRFKSLNENEICLNYFKYFLQTNHFASQLRKLITGSAQLNFGPSHIKKMVVCFPDVKEQKKIAEILGFADKIRQKDQQLVEHYDRLSQSLFLDMFGDPVKNPKGWPTKNLSHFFEDKPRIGTTKPATSDGTVKVVRVGEIGSKTIAFHKCQKVNLDDKQKERYLLHDGDIVLARAIGSIDHLGKASLFRAIDYPVLFDSHVMRLRFKQNLLHPIFFYHWMKSHGGRTIFLKNSGQTAVQFNVNAQQISRIEISVPFSDVQNQFVKSIGEIEKQKELAQQVLQKSDDLFNALLQKAFKGELTAS